MSVRQFPWTEVIVLALAAGLVMVLMYFGYKRQLATAPRYDTFSSFDAHSGGYRAWFELLSREGTRVVRFQQRPAFLDAAISTLIASPNYSELLLRIERTKDETGRLQAIDFDNMLAWVKNGGRLIWVTDGSWDSQLGVVTNANQSQEHDAAVAIAIAPETNSVNAVAGVDKLRVPFSSRFYTPLIADGGGAVVATRHLGKGTIIVVTDQSLFVNKRLINADNARLAYNLAGGGSRGTVAFDEYLHGYAAGSSWWTILPAPVRAAVIIAGAGLLLLLLGVTFRFGPTARLPDTSERTSAEYLSSMAHLLARGGATRKALRDLVGVTLHEVAGGLGLSERASIDDIVARLRFGDSGEERAAQMQELKALRALAQPTDKDLLRAAQLCATLRKEYSRYGRIGFGRRAAPIRRTA